MKKSFVAVIGHRESGKSSIIRALTGVKGQRSPELVEDVSTGKWIHVISHSPEECPLPDKQFRNVMNMVANSRLARGVVIALQPNRPSRRQSIEDIFRMAKAYRFNFRVFVIETPYQRNSRGTDPTEIEQRLTAVGVSVRAQPLDARRFAHINAAAIRNIVGWF